MNYSHKRKSFGLASRLLIAATLLVGGLFSLAPPASAWGLGTFSEHLLASGIANHARSAAGDHVAAPVDLPGGRSFSACTNLFPQQAPLNVASVNPEWKATALCSNHFAVLYSALSKTPLVVVERLNGVMIARAREEARTNLFFPDPRLPGGSRAELSDFAGSGFDRGHMSPAGDQPDPDSMAQSFALSNMIPQDPTNNRKMWAKIEKDVRKFVRRAHGDVFVFTGPIFDPEHRTIGANRVWVPTRIFKLVYDEASGRSWAYILPNTADARIEAPMDYPSFVKATGWSLLNDASVAQARRTVAF